MRQPRSERAAQGRHEADSAGRPLAIASTRRLSRSCAKSDRPG